MKAPKEGITAQWIRDKFVEVILVQPKRLRVAKSGKHFGKIGTHVATVGLRHAAGYEIVLKFEDGTVESFAPLSLYPVIEDQKKEKHDTAQHPETSEPLG